MPTSTLDAHAVLRPLDLTIDGPVRWGQAVRSRGPGIFLVERSTPDALAPLDIVAIRGWVERVPSLRLDGVAAEPGALADRLRSFWLPGQHVLYVGRTTKSLGARVAAMYATALGDRRPHSGGHWLRTLKDVQLLRLWWAETDAAEEYEDAVTSAIAETLTTAERSALPQGPVLPWANLESVAGDKRPTGLTGSLRDNEHAATGASRPAPGTTTRTGQRATSATRPAARPGTSRATSRTARSTTAAALATPVTDITAAGLEALTRELDELTRVKRPEVIARVKAARELGDLRENADYQAARNEQSFLEGRIQALEQMIKHARVIDAAATGDVVLGSTVRVSVEGEETTLHIVGSTEADPINGRISNASPVGRALVGHRAGDDVEVVTPARTLHYRILEVRQLDG